MTVDWQPTGGVSSYVRLLVAAQAEAGHDVLVVHAGPPAVAPDAIASSLGRVTVVSCPGSLYWSTSPDPAALASVVYAVEQFGPDLAHVHASDGYAIENAVRARVPTIKTLHNLFFCPTGTKYHAATGRVCTFKTGLMCLPRQAYLRCTTSKRPLVWWQNYHRTVEANAHHKTWDQLVVTSQYVRQQAMVNDFDGRRIAVVPYFTTLPDSPPPVSTRRVLFVGRVSREKGADLVLEAMAHVPGEWTAVVIGDGIDMAYVRHRAAALGMVDRVEFLGWLTGAPLDEQYRRAAVVVVPSRLPEPFGITGIESLAWARPVVAFDVGGIPEWLHNGVGGFRVPPGDARAMGQQIHQLLSNHALASSVAARGRARVEHDFTAAAHMARLEPIYHRAITRGI